MYIYICTCTRPMYTHVHAPTYTHMHIHNLAHVKIVRQHIAAVLDVKLIPLPCLLVYRSLSSALSVTNIFVCEFRVLQCVAVCCSVLQSVAECCSLSLTHILVCVASYCRSAKNSNQFIMCVAVCCSVLQCVAVCCTTQYIMKPVCVA